MTKATLCDRVCRKLQMTDDESIESCKEFFDHRYQMIWDYALWKDSQASETQALTAETQIVTLGATFEFPVAVRVGNMRLVPIDHGTVFQLDPEVFERTGTATAFINLAKDNSGRARIQLLEKPREAVEALILGKLKHTALADGEAPTLTGIENCLLAFVEGDMLELDRQYGKAGNKIAEGNAHLQKMRELENNQAAREPRIIPGGTGSEYDSAEIGYGY